ncbi:MAG: uroporphyrinogen-III C-methyltransferase [Rhodoplanes sp.]|uniref:siroheme synthase CysG n=1 Tax=Rhodoplanes sp. TaxID=1968906 RepID=UPI00184F7A78|nr:siroheme synthase CysG [Rhodoplanes sp.]NVO15522.1 uroporphyrinogen-III C-methyltransferase [Rhodoplanes sp.]
MPRLRYFPVSYDVADKTVLVIGDGEAALQKLRLLARTQARPVLCADAPEAALVRFAEQHGIDIRLGEPTTDLLHAAALAFVATGDEMRDATLAAVVRAHGVPVNVVDRPHLCDFATPAIVDRAPISIAIATDGAAPVLAQIVRAKIEALLPPGFGRLGVLAESLRETVLEHLPDNAARRRFWTKLFAGRAATAALAGEDERARVIALKTLNEESAATAPAGKVFLVGAGPGVEDLLTLRAHRLLLAADVIVHDALVPDAVVAMGRRDAERISVGKRKGCHSVPQSEIDALLVRLGREGRQVVRLKAGDPLVFGRAGEEMIALREAGIEHEVVPGVTSTLAAAADAKIPLTLRGVASHLVFASGHAAGDTEPEGFAAIAAGGGTVAIHMGRSVADRVATRLMEAGLAPATPTAAIENAGRLDQRVFAGALAELPALAARSDVDGPVLILIGPAVAHGDLSRAAPYRAATPNAVSAAA